VSAGGRAAGRETAVSSEQQGLAAMRCSKPMQAGRPICRQAHLVAGPRVPVKPAHGVLHPLLVVAGGEVLACMRATALLALLSRVHGDGCVHEQVLKLHSLHQVCVPHHAAVSQLDVLQVGQGGKEGRLGGQAGTQAGRAASGDGGRQKA
jgi:hypothetical protein